MMTLRQINRNTFCSNVVSTLVCATLIFEKRTGLQWRCRISEAAESGQGWALSRPAVRGELLVAGSQTAFAPRNMGCWDDKLCCHAQKSYGGNPSLRFGRTCFRQQVLRWKCSWRDSACWWNSTRGTARTHLSQLQAVVSAHRPGPVVLTWHFAAAAVPEA